MDEFPITGQSDTGDTASGSSVNVLCALAVGFVGCVVCALAVGLKFNLGSGDALVGANLLGGLAGTLFIGLLAGLHTVAEEAAAVRRPCHGGGGEQPWRPALGAFAVTGYSATVTAILALLVKYTIGLRLGEEEEVICIGAAEHAETGYDFTAVGSSSVLSHSEE